MAHSRNVSTRTTTGGNLCPACGQGYLSVSKFNKAETYCSRFKVCKYKGRAGGGVPVVLATEIKPLATPSVEQVAILKHLERSNGNVIIEALAGTGKTTTLVQAVRVLSARKLSVLALAFAVRDKNALTADVAGRATVQTSNAAGWAMLNTYAKRNGFRVGKLDNWTGANMLEDQFRIEGIIKKDPAGQEVWNIGRGVIGAVVTLVEKARSILPLSAVDPTLPRTPSETNYADLAARFGVEVKQEEWATVVSWCGWLFGKLANLNHIKAGTDYTSQIFLPSYHNLTPEQTYDRVMVDEAQDQSYATRRIAVLHLKANTGRLIAVGDRYQAIYGWRGADSAALEEMAAVMAEHGGEPARFPLTVCRRCAVSVLSVARNMVPTIQPKPDAQTGEVSYLSTDDQFIAQLSTERKGLVLCRANAPAISACLRLLANKVPAALVRSDIVGQLLKLIDRVTEENDGLNIEDVLAGVQTWAGDEIAKLVKRKCDTSKQQQIVTDKLETVFALATGPNIRTAGDLKRTIDVLFPAVAADVKIGERAEKMVLFSTVHGAKGGEADTVYLYSPSKNSKGSLWDAVWSDESDRDNVLYVALTRAERRLFLAGAAPTLSRMSKL